MLRLFPFRSKKRVALAATRAQVTVFVIISLVVLAVVAAGYFWREQLFGSEASRASQSVSSEALEKLPIRGYIEACIDKTAAEGLDLLGRQGGYLALDPIASSGTSAFWYLDQVNVQPTLDEVRIRLEEHLESELANCVDFSSFQAQGFEIFSGQVESTVSFNKDDVTIDIVYPVEISRGEQLKRQERFTSTLDFRFRRAFELASTIVNANLNPRFDVTRPLELIDSAPFTVDALRQGEALIFTITDPRQTRLGTHLQLSFASRFGNSVLERRQTLAPRSNVNALPAALTLYSLDRLAELRLSPGATISLSSQPVGALTVQQQYPTEITRPNTPFREHADNSVTRQDLTWRLAYPTYVFGPEGTRFNEPQTLRIYWDEETIPRQGSMGLLYTSGGTIQPIPAIVNYEEHYLEAPIIGFSTYTPLDCGIQPPKEVSAKAEIEPSKPLCVVKSLLWIVTGGVAAFWDLVLTLLGLDFYSGLIGYDSEEDFVAFVPACTQDIKVEEDAQDGEGKCSLKRGTVKVKGGHKVELCAAVKECDKIDRFLCKKCSMKCTTRYQ